MNASPSLNQGVEEACSSFAKAERAIETYESVSLENQLSALNELRYAGSHLLNAVRTESKRSVPFCEYNDDIYCSYKHSGRALNDVIDSSILTSLECIRNFLDKQYSEDELRGAKSLEYPKDFKEILEARHLLEDAGMAKSIVDGSREDVCIKRFRWLRLKIEKTMAELDAIRLARIEERDRNRQIQQQQEQKTAAIRYRREKIIKKRRDWLAFALAILAFAQAFWGCSVLKSKIISWCYSLRETSAFQGEQSGSTGGLSKENGNGQK